MNKNIITGVLLVTVFFMGFALVKTQSQLQQAATLSSTKESTSAPTSTMVSDVAMANATKVLNGVYKSSGKLSDEDISTFPAVSKEMLCQTGSEEGLLYNGECVPVNSLPDIVTATGIDPLRPAELPNNDSCLEYRWNSFTAYGILVVYRYCARRMEPAKALYL
jgi:hypothetical protein